MESNDQKSCCRLTFESKKLTKTAFDCEFKTYNYFITYRVVIEKNTKADNREYIRSTYQKVLKRLKTSVLNDIKSDVKLKYFAITIEYQY